MRCSAALNWRSPPRLSLWRSLRPELAGIGAAPAWRGKGPPGFESAAGAGPAVGGEGPAGLEALGTGGPADQRRGRQCPAAFELQQLGPVVGDELLDLALELVSSAGVLADAAQLVARDTDPRALGQSPQAPVDAVKPCHMAQRAGRDLRLELVVELQ